MVSGSLLTHPEPRDVRLVVPTLIEEAAQVKKLVACTLGEWDVKTALQAAAAFGVGTAEPQQHSLLTAVKGGPAPLSAGPAPPGAPSNPFGPPSAASASSAVSSNPFAAPAQPVSLRGGLGPAAGTNPQVLATAQAARRTGMIVGAAGVGSAGGPAGGAGGVLAGQRPPSSALHIDVERLFRSSADGPAAIGGGPSMPSGSSSSSSAASTGPLHIVLGAVDYSSMSVSRVLLRFVLKSFVEWTRAATIGPGGYQQIQVDLAALHLALPYFTSPPPPPGTAATAASAVSGGFDPYAGAGQLEELVNEAAVSASERCTDPRPLDNAVVFKLASDRVARVNLFIS